MTLPEVLDLFDYWQQHPPAHEMIAAYLGYKPPAKAGKSPKKSAQDFAEFYAEMSGGSLPF